MAMKSTSSSRRRPSIPVLIGLLAIGLAFAWNPGPRTQGDRQQAMAIYRANCASCHGIEGRGDGPDAARLPGGVPTLMTPKLSGGNGLGSVRHSIAEGRPQRGMPGFRGKLTSHELDLVAWEIVRMRKAYAKAHPEEMQTWTSRFRSALREMHAD